ncbi:MAG TPA: type I phosphomannose isomerase catalytic subunit [Armatimonadota bacterium]|jgi:mannose-6-phosphate isomerase
MPDPTHTFVAYPLIFQDTFKERVWGGQTLRKLLGKGVPPGRPIGESWEIVDHRSDSSVVANGPYAGRTLSDLRVQFGPELVGEAPLALGRGQLPLLLKFLDAREDLSVQVHPKDDYAFKHENGELGKTEMWYVVHAEPGARLITGLRAGIDRPKLEAAISEGRVKECLEETPVQAGDIFFTPAGRVHAVGKGLVIWECQQNSDVTYRFYDWDRVGLDGKPRELHIQKSLDVIDYQATDSAQVHPQARDEGGNTVYPMVQCPYFCADKVELRAARDEETHGSFRILTVLEGEVDARVGDAEPVRLGRGRSCLVPCAAGTVRLEPHGGSAVLLEAWCPVA